MGGGTRLLAVPGLRDVLNACLTDVIHQREGQSVRVWPAELIYAGTFAIFGKRPLSASFLSCHGIAGKCIGAPDLCLWLCRCNVKRSVGIDCPDRAQRISPLAGERSWARAWDSFTGSDDCY